MSTRRDFSRNGPFIRGSHSGRGGSRRTQPILPPSPDIALMEGLREPPLKTLDKPPEVEGDNIQVKDLEHIGSYNWVNSSGGESAILVPGSPPEWRDKPLPYSVPPDTDEFFSLNHSEISLHPFLPLFKAVDVVTEEYATAQMDWAQIDFITDRNGLRKLLRWISDTDATAKNFRIDMELAGRRTVLLNRWENMTTEAPMLQWATYGNSFIKQSTSPAAGCEQSTYHHRIVKYDFDGLNIILGFQVDACLPPSSIVAALRPPRIMTIDDITDILSGLNTSPTTAPPSNVDLKIIHGGTLIPQDSLIELATRSERNAANYNWAETYPQLFLSQTSHHYLAVHTRGHFDRVIKRKLDGPELKDMDPLFQGQFRKLRYLLQVIQELVKEHGQRGRLSLVCVDGKLKVFERISDDSCLPEDIMSRFGFGS